MDSDRLKATMLIIDNINIENDELFHQIETITKQINQNTEIIRILMEQVRCQIN